MANIFNRVTNSENNNSNQQSRNGSNNSWHDPKDVRRKAQKSIATQFTKKLSSGKFSDNWERHQERFLKACREWEI